MYLFVFILGCIGSSFLCMGSLQLRRAGATPRHGARVSHHGGLSRCRAQAPAARVSAVVACGLSSCGSQAQYLWPTDLAALRHVGSSRTRARTHVPRIGRRTFNHCATRDAPTLSF